MPTKFIYMRLIYEYYICKYVGYKLQQMNSAPEKAAAMLNSACTETPPGVQCGQMTRSR